MNKERLQEWLNKAVTGLSSQGFERSYSSSTATCMFRGDNGRKCAVGYLITDEQLHAAIAKERGIVYHREDPKWFREPSPYIVMQELTTDHKEASFLEYLQNCHDGSSGPFEMKNRLVSLARNNGLTVPPELI